MDDVKIGEILQPGTEREQESRARRVRKHFWKTLKKALCVLWCRSVFRSGNS